MAHEQQREQPATPAPRNITNPFAPEPPPRVAQIAANTANQQRRRTGLIPLCIGASRMLSLADGKRQFEARELRIEAARAERDGRTLRVGCVCFECRRMFESYEALAAAHPPAATMRENDECHTWAYWCDDQYDAKALENIEALRAEVKALEQTRRASLAALSQKKDVEEMVKERKRADDLGTMLDDARKRLKYEQDNIIGLMSETPFTA